MNSYTDKVTFKCLPVIQPIGTFYIGAMAAEDLVSIAWADVRRIAPNDPVFNGHDVYPAQASIFSLYEDDVDIEEMDKDFKGIDEQDFETFLGIQRELSRRRVKELTQYVTNVDATFPTSVLLAVSSRVASYDEENSTISIARDDRAAKIIDGQHRIAGLRNYNGPTFDVNVSIFVDMDIQDQAMVFATINLSQTKVNKSLAYDLYELTKSRSPQRTAHDIVRFLNYKQGSPFKSKIKMLGTAINPGEETITQAAFVDRLLRYISRDPMGDRDKLRRGRKLTRISGASEGRQIFRNLFINERDANITIILWNYFLAVRDRWPDSWDNVERGNIFNRTTGFGALMRFLRVAYNSAERPSRMVLHDDFSKMFQRIQLEDGSFTPDEYVPGGSGEKKLFDALVRQARLQQYK